MTPHKLLQPTVNPLPQVAGGRAQALGGKEMALYPKHGAYTIARSTAGSTMRKQPNSLLG